MTDRDRDRDVRERCAEIADKIAGQMDRDGKYAQRQGHIRQFDECRAAECTALRIAGDIRALDLPLTSAREVTDAMVDAAFNWDALNALPTWREQIRGIIQAALASAPQPAMPEPSAADMAAFGASDAACYRYPGEDEAPLRHAFCEGAAHCVGVGGIAALHAWALKPRQVHSILLMGQQVAEGQALALALTSSFSPAPSPQAGGVKP